MNIDILISEVEKRPNLWKPSNVDYRDKKKKEKSWNEICSALFPEFNSKPDSLKRACVQKVMAKWRNIRDSYVRNVRRREIEGDSGVKSYYYHDSLNFLSFLSKKREQKCAKTTPTKVEPVKSDSNDSFEDSCDLPGSSPGVKPVQDQESLSNSKSMERLKINVEKALLTFVENNRRNQVISDDEDMAFFRSLLPAVQTLTLDEKMNFRIQVMHVLQNFRQSANDIQFAQLNCNPEEIIPS